MKSKFILFLASMLLISGCSRFVSNYHKQFDEEEDKRREFEPDTTDKFSMFRNKKKPKVAPEQSTNTENTPNMDPIVKRNYQEAPQRRVSVDDLADNGSDGSLWQGQGQNNFLFAKNSQKKLGDIVVFKVMSKLKNEITTELSRAYPEKKVKKKKNDKTPSDETKKEEDGETAKNAEESGDKVFDLVSGVVVEEINKDHLLVRGRKDVLYQERKRKVEIEAMVSRKDIADDDGVMSSNFLESNVSVLR